MAYSPLLNRLLDLFGGIALLLFFSPFFIILPLIIVMDSPGNPFFIQQRVGRGGKKFLLFKLRTMHHHAEKEMKKYSHLNEADGPAFKMKNDPRLTTVGRFLRETNLDELPQLFNVLLVDMSLVGPRPPLPEEVKKYKPWQRKRLTVKPGLTCFWNLRGSHRLSFDEWVRSDIEYIKEKTFLLDIEILLLTFIFFIKQFFRQILLVLKTIILKCTF
ncbi:sugar transferase [Candidatus Woesearchaeota archaeon]|nr:sugar transferase [Candidatus Woesearchaeota archaeon]HIH38162.1 sugar transferase [Candidatus Woesearchaeota archaeon]HIH49808.1 sugar transferase [Candidatus Woesearchaeota archaeon]HIJ03654.1 sugar transferase [Candidatus Woesearchaeota archaeon]